MGGEPNRSLPRLDVTEKEVAGLDSEESVVSEFSAGPEFSVEDSLPEGVDAHESVFGSGIDGDLTPLQRQHIADTHVFLGHA
jgi:hypothetical protein